MSFKESNTVVKAGRTLLRTALAVLVCAAVWTDAAAAPVSRSEARQKAQQFLMQQGDSRVLVDVDNSKALSPRRKASAATTAGQGTAPYYAFNRAGGDGFVIVAGDDNVNETLLGYSDSGTFDYDKLPPALQELLDDYAQQVERARLSSTAPQRIATHPAVKPLVTSKWSQGSPYNNECPMYFSLGRSVTGCVATAYAQILYYHRDKMVTETQAAMPAYDTWTEHETFGHLHVAGIPKGSPIDWENMIDNYGSGATDRQCLAVAQLMHYCGVAVNMDYTNSASAANSYSVYDALINYFGFGSGVSLVYDKTNEEWDALVYKEVSEGRPVYISGADQTMGHAFVCDGYDGNARFHINWGWAGQSDGYYYLTNLTPGNGQGIGGSGDGYTDNRQVIIGIEPENYMERTMSFSDATAQKLCTAAFDTDGDGKLTYGEAATVTTLGTVFQGSALTTLTELHYFTALTSIGDDAFSGCSKLTDVQLPKSITSIGARAFKDCAKISTLVLPDALTSIGEEAFSGCRMLKNVELPHGIHALPSRAFSGCAAISALELPCAIAGIGDEAFSGCTALKSVTINTVVPQNISMGTDVFANSGAAAGVLHVMQGQRTYFASHPQWSAFNTIKERRDYSGGQFAPLTTGVQVYLYNVGTGRYLTHGEAYGTQAVVSSSSPMRFTLRRTTSMPADTYFLYSNDTGNDGHYLFRTADDGNVGKGVRATFVDGGSADKRSHWLVTDIGDNTYTISVPEGYDGYDAACRWGVMTSHASNAAAPTWGVYSDIVYAGHEADCQWRFVLYDADYAAKYAVAAKLENLIALAAAKHLSYQAEQDVLDNMESTVDELRAAQKPLRQRLKLIDFADEEVRSICLENFDLDIDGELSLEEASYILDLAWKYRNKSYTTFNELKLFTNLPAIYGNTFENCTKLESVTLPESIERIYYWAFRNCRSLRSINLPEYLNYIGELAFGGCTSLKTVIVDSPDPSTITVSSDAFSGVPLASATLMVPAGSKELYAAAPVWKDFGTIVEHRTRTQPEYSPIAANVKGYIFNIGTRKMLNKGEAYGTQSVVKKSGLVYELRRTAAMPEGQYYLIIPDVEKGVMFRVDSDKKVGVGVKACFADGAQPTKAYWQLSTVEGNIFTLQVPQADTAYVAGQYLGVDYNHKSDAAGPTNGVYYDVSMSDNEKQCLWAFISLEDYEKAKVTDAGVDELKRLLELCADRNIDNAAEQAVYDNLLSTDDDISAAIGSLRHKLHYIDFTDAHAKTICTAAWDSDGDGELSTDEAAAVTELGETFRNKTLVQSLEELRYFTGLTEIPANAFRGSSALIDICLPEHVSALGDYAFNGCSALKYVALLNSDGVVPKGLSAIGTKVTLFVPEALVDAYMEDGNWKSNTVTAYTGVPTVTAVSLNRQYGRSNVRTSYEVTGAPVNGVPTVVCDQLRDTKAVVGQYPISISAGTITTAGLVCNNGMLTVEPAELTITAKSYTRQQGDANPAFEVEYKGFRNSEKSDVLLRQPVVSCEATADSPAGSYPITVSGAEAQNYAITYVDGVLTVEERTAIDAVNANVNANANYDLQGRRVERAARRGVYIGGNRKKVVKR